MKIIVLSCLVFSILLNQYQSSAQNNFIAVASIDPATAIVNNLKCRIQKDRVFLEWTIGNNQLVSQIEVESSADGKNYVMAGLVFSTEKKTATPIIFMKKPKQLKYFIA